MKRSARSSRATRRSHTHLELAREEIRKLRTERDQLQHNARLHLGQELDQIGAAGLTIRVHELNQEKPELEALLGAKTAEADDLARQVTESKTSSPQPAPASVR
ncbi:hypothetical protein [Streptomyces sp. NPDC000618]|uniref:hypothetical protein n=1 Tax=Streptomyces sp. NPDC000618 TaxID=3154265 RepID=UPI00332B8DE7